MQKTYQICDIFCMIVIYKERQLWQNRKKEQAGA